jgi:hypothetical protein
VKDRKSKIACWSCGKLTEVKYIGENTHKQECRECKEWRAERYAVLCKNTEKERLENAK